MSGLPDLISWVDLLINLKYFTRTVETTIKQNIMD